MFELSSKELKLVLHHPEDGFYQGTRFDRSGVFDSILFHGIEMAGAWFEKYSPTMHDAVQGPAEEFTPSSPIPVPSSPIPVPSSSGPTTPSSSGLSRGSLKIGVGLLSTGSDPYDRFRLYEIVDSGTWTVEANEKSVAFRHVLNGIYDYRKEIVLTGHNSFEIRHTLDSDIPLEGEVYNHNFFTMGRMVTGPSRLIDFPFCPAGTWRAVYDSVGFTPSGIRFSRELNPGESVFTGDIHVEGSQGMPYAMTLREKDFSVKISGDVPVTHTVMWANHRIACLEPYNAFRSAPAHPFRWTVRYLLGQV